VRPVIPPFSHRRHYSHRCDLGLGAPSTWVELPSCNWKVNASNQTNMQLLLLTIVTHKYRMGRYRWRVSERQFNLFLKLHGQAPSTIIGHTQHVYFNDDRLKSAEPAICRPAEELSGHAYMPHRQARKLQPKKAVGSCHRSSRKASVNHLDDYHYLELTSSVHVYAPLFL
jgi:hypothetical protein